MNVWLDRLPHGPESRHLTDVLSMAPGVSGEGVASFGLDEPWAASHFPGRPIVPGVVIIEALAQLAGLAAFGGDENSETAQARGGMLAQVDVRLVKPVEPPASIDLVVSVDRRLGSLAQCSVRASVDDVVVCTGSLTVAEAAP